MTRALTPQWVRDAVEAGLKDAQAEIRRREQQAAREAAYAVGVQQLDAATDPAWRAVLDLHCREVGWEGSTRFTCEACPGGCCDVIYWPCATARLAAEHLGIDLPEDRWGEGMDRPKDGSLDPVGAS